MTTNTAEGKLADRFPFGENWSKFLGTVDDGSIAEAEVSLKRMLDVSGLADKTFLDIGSGSGLFSLAARRLGARVHSFDYDPQSVACTRALRDQHFPNDAGWHVDVGSVLDIAYLRSLGQFDVVYAWGVLHHTGDMWRALEYVHTSVAPGGKLFVAIYNDAGSQTRRWRWIKRKYNELPRVLRVPFTLLVISPAEAKEGLRALLSLRPGEYIRGWTAYANGRRGMNRWRDIVDWVGGYPYEVAAPEEIFDFFRDRGYVLAKLKCGGVGTGCNQFVFSRAATGH